MKTIYSKSLAAFVAVAGLTLPLSTALAQDTSSGIQVASTTTTSTAAPAPQMAYGVGQILQLSQAKVGDDIIISYIKNSGNSYGLNADQIIYLRQQGISTPVLNAMLSQPAPGLYYNSTASVPMPSTPAPPVQYSQYAQPPPQTVTPAVTGIDPTAAAAAAGYYQSYPDYYPSYYGYGYPYYSGYYPVGIPVGFGWGWRGGWGGGWHGGGWGGGGFHGGGFGGFHGGGFGGGGVFHGGGFGGGGHGGHR